MPSSWVRGNTCKLTPEGKALNSLLDGLNQFHLPETVVYAKGTEQFSMVISALKSLEPRRTGGLGMDSHKIARLAQQK